jgi:hypothetical protein
MRRWFSVWWEPWVVPEKEARYSKLNNSQKGYSLEYSREVRSRVVCCKRLEVWAQTGRR